MSLPELYELQHCLVHVADVVACAIIKRQQPAADLVTKRALYREFGRGWVDKHIAPRGKIEGKRFGTAPNSPIKYSRTEFVALLEAERLQRAEIIGNTDSRSSQNKPFRSLYRTGRPNTRQQHESRKNSKFDKNNMQALKYTSREVNRNFRIKVSGLGIHELKGFTGFVGLVGSELANNLLDRAFRSRADKVECKLRRGLKITFYYK